MPSSNSVGSTNPSPTDILKFLRGRIEKLDDPRKIGERLQGPLGDFWKYRVGDYRVICSIQDDKLVVWVVRMGTGARFIPAE